VCVCVCLFNHRFIEYDGVHDHMSVYVRVCMRMRA
jgi:hypothetical protein